MLAYIYAKFTIVQRKFASTGKSSCETFPSINYLKKMLMIEGNFVGIRRSGYKARRSEKFVGYKRGNLAYV